MNELLRCLNNTFSRACCLTFLLHSRYDQGILDVGLTDEDHVELVRTHSYIRKHATGSAKIELHVLQVQHSSSLRLSTRA